MTRERERHRPGSAADRRRAQTYLAQLDWLEGIDGSWRRWENDEPFVPDGAEIAKTRRAARTVMREHATALPKLVGDVDAWWAIVDAKLAWCSACAGGSKAAFDPKPFLSPRIVRVLDGLCDSDVGRAGGGAVVGNGRRERELRGGGDMPRANRLRGGVVGEAARRASVAWVGRPEVLERALAWFASRADVLGALPIAADELAPIAILLVRMVVIGDPGKAAAARERGVDALIALLAVDAPDPKAALDVTRNVESRLRGNRAKGATSKDASKPKRSRPRVFAWLRKLAGFSGANRQRALMLIAEAGIAEALGAWEAWERDHAALLVRATELSRHHFEVWDKAVHGTRVVDKLEKMRAAAPIPVSIGDVTAEIDMLSDDMLIRFHASIVRFLAAVPFAVLPAAIAPTAHARMLLHCARTAALAVDTERVEWAWDALADAFEHGAPPSLLEPWRSTLATEHRTYVEGNFVEDIKRKPDVARAVRVIVDVANQRRTLSLDDAQRTAVWIKAGLTDEALIAEIVIGLRDVDERLEPDIARAILALADDDLAAARRDDTTAGAGATARSRSERGGSGESVAKRADASGPGGREENVAKRAGTNRLPSEQAARIERVGRTVMAVTKPLRWATVRRLVTLFEHAAKSGGGWIVRGFLDAEQGNVLEGVADIFPLLPRSKLPALVTPRDSAWIARYPVALAPALQRLASVDPDAEATAARRLADDFPNPEALKREIAALRERVESRAADPDAASRRRAASQPPDPDTESRVAARDRSGGGLAKRLASLEARLASPKTPSPKRLANLAEKLDRGAREIGLARFRTALVEAASARLVRMFGLGTWPDWGWEPRTLAILFALMALEPVDRELAGRLLRARCGPPPWDLRDDPVNRAYLDQMRRAGIDPTPWLDDSPRVVKVRDESLTLALSSDPLEVFAMGAHFETCLSPDGGNFFSVIANAADINKRVLYARRGGTVVGRCLFALTDGFALLAFQAYCHEQFDFTGIVRDFALDLAKRMGATVVPRGAVRTLLSRDWYDDGSRDLVGRFKGLDEAGLDLGTIEPSRLVGVLRAALDREIDDVTLPVIIGHHGVRGRPSLIVPLAPFVLASATPLTRVSAAELAMNAGDLALADRMLGDHADIIRVRHHVGPHAELLARLRPSYALARLRETRGSDIRTWKDETGDRIALAGLALETLHRPKQAAEMYRLAMVEEYLVPVMRSRLEALGERVDP